MLIRYGDLWTFWEKGAWAVVTTNTCVKRDGTAVMGRGIARQAAERFPDLPALYGEYISVTDRNEIPTNERLVWAGDGFCEHPVLVPECRVVLFPTKQDWRDPSPLDLIKGSLAGFDQLWRGYCAEYLDCSTNSGPYVAFPPLGCGNGGRDWEGEVQPFVERYLHSWTRYAVILPEAWRPQRE